MQGLSSLHEGLSVALRQEHLWSGLDGQSRTYRDSAAGSKSLAGQQPARSLYPGRARFRGPTITAPDGEGPRRQEGTDGRLSRGRSSPFHGFREGFPPHRPRRGTLGRHSLRPVAAKQHAESYARPEAWAPRRPKSHSARQQYGGPPAGQSAMEQRQISGAPRNLSPPRSAAFGAWEEQRDRQVEGAAQNLAAPRTPAFQADPEHLDLQLSDAAQKLTASRSPAFGGKAEQPEQHLDSAPRNRTASRLPSFKAMAEQLERQLNYAAQNLSVSRSPAGQSAMEQRQISGAPRNFSPPRLAAFGAWEEQRDRQVKGAAQNLAAPRTPAFQADPEHLDLQLSDAAQKLTASRSPAFGGKAEQPEQHLDSAPRNRTASRLPSFKVMAEQLERQLNDAAQNLSASRSPAFRASTAFAAMGEQLDQQPNHAAQNLSASRSPAFEAEAEHEAGPVNSGEALQPGYQMAQDVIASQVERDAPNKYRGWVTAAAEHEGKSAICPALHSASKLGNLLSTLHRESSAHISQRENHLGIPHAPLQVHHGIAATMGHASKNAHSCVPDISCMPAMQDRGLMERQGWRVEEMPTVSSTTFSGMQRRHASREMMRRLQTS